MAEVPMILFVTSFDDELYRASGRDLIRTFLEFQKIGKLLLCFEGGGPNEIDGDRVLGFDITQDPFLIEWEGKYRQTCEKESNYWRRRAWQWYRKVISLRLALRYLDPGWLVWLDCDCEFKSEIGFKFLDGLAGPGRGVFYLHGDREWTETGVLIFDCKNMSARRVLEGFFAWYDSGRFLELDRWDDCWIFDKVRSEFIKPLFYDLVLPCEPAKGKPDLNVVHRSRLAPFLAHKKGSHLRLGIR